MFLVCGEFLLDLVREQTHRVISHHLMFGGSYQSLVYNANDVVNRTPNGSIKIPSTKYKIKKFMEPIFKSEIHIKCKQFCN